MKSITFENVKEIKSVIGEKTTVMYGAGGNGQRILDVLKNYGLRIDFFCDDDYNKWGKIFCDINVISFGQLKDMSEKAPVNVVLTSVFGGPILGKLEGLDIDVYEAFSILIDKYYNNSFYKVPLTNEEIAGLSSQIDQVENAINDKVSIEILEKIKFTIRNPGVKDYSRFYSVASKEDCYFVSEVLKSLPEKPVIIDCGGFTGDLMVALKKHGISYEKVYSFEVNKSLFEEMKENIAANSLEDCFIPINKGVWDSEGESFLDVSPEDVAGGKVGDGYDTGEKIETVKIDNYFEDISYDYIKMDIEGAERNAIMGGWNTITEYRPIMAISLYHSVHDVVDIPLKLTQELENYRFFIRHHSFIDSETVLYCIPREKWRD